MDRIPTKTENYSNAIKKNHLDWKTIFFGSISQKVWNFFPRFFPVLFIPQFSSGQQKMVHMFNNFKKHLRSIFSPFQTISSNFVFPIFDQILTQVQQNFGQKCKQNFLSIFLPFQVISSNFVFFPIF